MKGKNIILIGMPGVGKSTVGVVLAKKLGYAFVDADLVIQSREGKLLYEIIAERGVEGFWRLEEAVGESVETERTVIATGGSAVYGKKAMAHYKRIGTVVYLSLPLEGIRERLGDLTERGRIWTGCMWSGSRYMNGMPMPRWIAKGCQSGRL